MHGNTHAAAATQERAEGLTGGAAHLKHSPMPAPLLRNREEQELQCEGFCGSRRSCEALQEQQQALNIHKQGSNELRSILGGSLHLGCPYILLIIRLEGS